MKAKILILCLLNTGVVCAAAAQDDVVFIPRIVPGDEPVTMTVSPYLQSLTRAERYSGVVNRQITGQEGRVITVEILFAAMQERVLGQLRASNTVERGRDFLVHHFEPQRGTLHVFERQQNNAHDKFELPL